MDIETADILTLNIKSFLHTQIARKEVKSPSTAANKYNKAVQVRPKIYLATLSQLSVKTRNPRSPEF